jgi:hypothetical protein
MINFPDNDIPQYSTGFILKSLATGEYVVFKGYPFSGDHFKHIDGTPDSGLNIYESKCIRNGIDVTKGFHVSEWMKIDGKFIVKPLCGRVYDAH